MKFIWEKKMQILSMKLWTLLTFAVAHNKPIFRFLENTKNINQMLENNVYIVGTLHSVKFWLNRESQI